MSLSFSARDSMSRDMVPKEQERVKNMSINEKEIFNMFDLVICLCGLFGMAVPGIIMYLN